VTQRGAKGAERRLGFRAAQPRSEAGRERSRVEFRRAQPAEVEGNHGPVPVGERVQAPYHARPATVGNHRHASRRAGLNYRLHAGGVAGPQHGVRGVLQMPRAQADQVGIAAPRRVADAVVRPVEDLAGHRANVVGDGTRLG
jgi:hypothetical protein